MFWSDELAEKLKERKLSLEWIDDMKTPSGRIHVGALRGVVVHDLVYKSLTEAGVKATYSYVFEDHDPMDDIPSYLPREQFEQYLGMPLFKIPSPEPGFENYARFYAEEFKKVFNAIGCRPEIIWTQDLYKSGRMNPVIKECLDNAQEIRKIYEEMYKRELPDNWYPFQLYCPECGKVSTTVVSDWNGEEVTYRCEVEKVKWTKGCGASGKASPFSDEKEMVGKLPWKVEWPAKWKVIGVTVEGAGKDHMSRGGSHDMATQICNRVLNYAVPYPIPYEWLLIGGRKMSSSKGVGASATEMLEILPPELIRFLMVRSKITQQINFDPSEPKTIPNLFDEYQKAAEAYQTKSDLDMARVFELSQINGINMPPSIRFSVLTQWVQMPNLQEKIREQGLEEWAVYARVWVDKYALAAEKFVVQQTLPPDTVQLSDGQKAFLKKVSEQLSNSWEPDEFQKQLFEWAKQTDISSKDAFAALYTALLGKNHGPKAGWLILSLEKDFVHNRLLLTA